MANSKTTTLVLRFAAILALAIFATAALACSSTPAAANPGSGSGSGSQEGSSSTTAPQTGESVDFANLKGDITIDGSSTAYPISEAVAEEFGLLTNGNARVTVGVSGSGGGFKKFCNGESRHLQCLPPHQAERSPSLLGRRY